MESEESKNRRKRTERITKLGIDFGRDVFIIVMNFFVLWLIRAKGYSDGLFFVFVCFTAFYTVGAYRAFTELARLIRGDDIEEERRRRWRESIEPYRDAANESADADADGDGQEGNG